MFLEAEIKKLREVHASELAYERQLNEKLRDDLDRVRLFITPSLQQINLHPDTAPASEEPKKEVAPTGTPWQRVRARMIEEENARWKLQEEQKKRDRESGKTKPEVTN